MKKSFSFVILHFVGPEPSNRTLKNVDFRFEKYLFYFQMSFKFPDLEEDEAKQTSCSK